MQTVKVWEEKVIIPTYEIGEADKNPIFLNKRVYQGSSGKIYPYPTIEKIKDEKVDKEYNAVYLENEYIKVMILPELGGRIQRAYDKTNDYDFVYYNHVIKPALVGLTGPWISGGIEFNWPQHHRPTTFLPVDYCLQENEDGSKTVLVNDVDQMYGTKGIAGFTLYPGKAYIEVRGQLYNRTATPQTFLWWANPAVPVNDHTQSVFPPDVHAVMDHGKRDVSRFPIAKGVYYKHDYSEGVDISRYKNIPVPTSYMAEKSEYDFVGGYDYSVEAGILHVADHHISPGKKQWTWGCGDFGKAWDKNLTDADGPYIELMTGVYTDNQPDFTWLKPFEEKTFKQYFMPYKTVGAVKNATINAMVNMEVKENSVCIFAYATGKYENAVIMLKNKGKVVWEEKTALSPIETFKKEIEITIEKETDLEICIESEGELLVSYTPQEQTIEKIPEPAKAAKEPEEIMTNEELYLTGLHIEQYRHATYTPDPYYLEGLKRDNGDIRINNAYGSLLFRRGLFVEAEEHFRKAIERLTWKNPNPYDSEAYYNLGLVLFYQDKKDDAFDAFYKATWTNEQQEMSFYYLAAIEAQRGHYGEALEFIEKALIKNSHNIKARGLKAYLLRKTGCINEADKWILENIKIDKFDYVSRFELVLLQEKNDQINTELKTLMRNFVENYLQAARDYAEFGAYEEAIFVLRACSEAWPMLKYYEAYYSFQMENNNAVCMEGNVSLESNRVIEEAEAYSSDYCFPNKLEDIAVLTYAIDTYKKAAKANYYLGNLCYDKAQYETAVRLWEKSVKIDNTFPTVLRNLALAYYNKMHMHTEARELLEKAFSINTKDARIFLELDQLYKKENVSFVERLMKYEQYKDTFMERDDLYIEYVTLHNLLGEHKRAYELIKLRKFHPWEGGEGKITTQYTIALVEMAKECLAKGSIVHAKELLEAALTYPENLGEGKLEGTKNNHIYYYLGCVYEQLGENEEAKAYFEKAAVGTQEPAGMMYYNDQPADMILYQGLANLKLGKKAEANARFYKLIDYGERHIFDEMKIEYFAVSLPDFIIFEEDLNKKNEVHCHYLIGLGNLGIANKDKAKESFEKALKIDPSHMQCIMYEKMV